MEAKVIKNPCKFRRNVLKNEDDKLMQKHDAMLLAKGGDRRMEARGFQIGPDPRVAFI
jgi:hypothetical protein